MSGIDGVLFDIDGVIVTSWRPIDGAPGAVRELRERGLRRSFLTNTTSRTRGEIAQRLTSVGVEVDIDEIVTAAKLTAEYLRANHPEARVWVLNSGDIETDLEGIALDDANPDVVVIGGAGEEFTHRTLSRVVELMLDGIPVVAMHSGMMWATDDGLRIDTGAYLPGLEQAGNARITVLGKSAAPGFTTSAELMGISVGNILMIGDDLHGDVIAAQNAGMTGVLVRTGKFRESVLVDAPEPDYVIDSIADLPALIAELNR